MMADTGSVPKSSRSDKKWGEGVGNIKHKQQVGKFSNNDPDMYLDDGYSRKKEVNYQQLVNSDLIDPKTIGENDIQTYD